jgi:small subunit ribosomal protein S2
MAYITVRELLEAGVHFGHQTKRWNPKMKKYIFGARNGIYIIDLQQTVKLYKKAHDFIKSVATEGKDILFVGTKKQASESIYEEANRSESFYVENRWLGGMLTNFQTIKNNITRFHFLQGLENDGSLENYPKKEQGKMLKDKAKLEFAIGGISTMKRLPGAIFVIDPKNEAIAIKEGRRLGIPIVAVVDTNCDPDGIDFVIPGNDDAIRSIRLFASRIADATIEGHQIYKERQSAQSDKGEAEGRPPEKVEEKVGVEVLSDGTDGPVVEKIIRKTTPVEEVVVDAPAVDAPAVVAPAVDAPAVDATVETTKEVTE